MSQTVKEAKTLHDISLNMTGNFAHEISLVIESYSGEKDKDDDTDAIGEQREREDNEDDKSDEGLSTLNRHHRSHRSRFIPQLSPTMSMHDVNYLDEASTASA